MKIAIPTRHNKLCSIMDHCDVLTIVTVEDHRIKSEKYLEIPFYNTINYSERLIKLKKYEVQFLVEKVFNGNEFLPFEDDGKA